MFDVLAPYTNGAIDEKRLAHIRSLQKSVFTSCAPFDDAYWKQVDSDKAYPTAFVDAMQQAGYLSVLIPTEYGGRGDKILEAGIVLSVISQTGAYAGACHAQLYTMYSLLRHGSNTQKASLFPQLASGKARLLSFGVTEPDAGTDTTSIATTAVDEGEHYRINGQKVWIGRVLQTDYMLLLARTKDKTTSKTDGLTLFLVDAKTAQQQGTLQAKLIDSAINSQSCRLQFHDMLVPAANIVGKRDEGFRIVLDALNAERILIAAESIGNSYYLLQKAIDYAKNRQIFGRPIGQNQAVQFPLARAYSQIKSAELVIKEAILTYERNAPCGEIANLAKLVATESAFYTADVCMDTFGGYAFDNDYAIERKFRETRLYRNAPIATNFVLSFLAEQALDLPRSF